MQEDNKLPAKKEDEQEEFNVGRVAHTLHTAAKDLLAKEVTSSSVNAACNCAQQITQLIRVHLEAKRLSVRLKTLKGEG